MALHGLWRLQVRRGKGSALIRERGTHFVSNRGALMSPRQVYRPIRVSQYDQMALWTSLEEQRNHDPGRWYANRNSTDSVEGLHRRNLVRGEGEVPRRHRDPQRQDRAGLDRVGAAVIVAVMPGLVPGIHVFLRRQEGVDGRDEPGHDEEQQAMME